MERRKEGEPAPQGKYVLIAHLRGTNKYILSDENANLVPCGEEKVIQHRHDEDLISFKSLEVILWERARARVRLHLLSPKKVEDYVNDRITKIIAGAITFLDYPPKKRVNFYSVPEEIIKRFDWVFRKPLRW